MTPCLIQPKKPTLTKKKKTSQIDAKPLILVDGSSYLYRAFHALPALTTSEGTPTGALLGVLNMLYKLLDEYDPDSIAVVFDAPGGTFRNDLYKEYKANRPPMPDDLRSQVDPLLQAIELLGIPLLRVPKVEADDVIGTLSRQAAAKGQATVISTSDKDMAQLVDDRVTLVNTMSDTRLDPDGVEKKFGVAPEQIIDYLALIGDTSDNIPGVPGVGPKTAAKWLAQYQDLDGVLANAQAIKGKAGENLRGAAEDLPLYRELVTIRVDVELDEAPESLTRRPIDAEGLTELYRRFELKSLYRRLGGDGESPQDDSAESQPGNYTTIFEEAELDAWIERLEQSDLVAFDTETTSLNYMAAEIVGLSFSVAEGEAAYLPLAHRYPGAPDQIDRQQALDKLKPWIENECKHKVGHHLKYDAHVLLNHGLTLKGVSYDTMLESYVLNSTATRHDMDSVARRYLDVETTSFEDVAGKGAKQLCFDEVDIDTATHYAAEDADVTLKLHRKLWPQLQSLPKLETLYRDLEQPLVDVLAKMEYHGVLVDAGMLKKQSQELAESMLELEEAAYVEADGPFNLGSPKQLQEVLYDRLSLPVLGKTPKGQPSTAEGVLSELAETYPLPRLILEYRGLSKLKSTYTDKLPLLINEKSGRIHTSYHQAVAATGRLSSSDPNLQNIPVRTGEGRRIRQAFVAPKGFVILAADYSQIELRIMAHLSGDDGLLSAFAAGEDIHRATAAEVFGFEPDQVNADQRRSAKAINFGLIYGMSAFGLAKQLGIERGEAQSYVNRYFDRYPGVKAYMDRTRAEAKEQGFVETVAGRRLYLPEIRSRNVQRRQYAERSAINAPMQGTAADIIKRAMIDVDAWLEQSESKARLVMQVHDELVLEVPKSDAKTVGKTIVNIMAKAANLSVPLAVDVGVGQNWDEAH